MCRYTVAQIITSPARTIGENYRNIRHAFRITWLCRPLSVTFINCNTRADSSASRTSCDSTLITVTAKIRKSYQSLSNEISTVLWRWRVFLPATSALFYLNDSSYNMNDPCKLGFNNRKFTIITTLKPSSFLFQSKRYISD